MYPLKYLKAFNCGIKNIHNSRCISYKWNPTIAVFLWQAYTLSMFARFTRMSKLRSFLRVNSVSTF